MPALGPFLDRVFGAEVVHHECRHCGTTLDTENSRCPACDSVDIATYRFT